MAKKVELTSKQEAFLVTLVQYIRREKRPPTTRELKQLMGFSSPRSVAQYLDALEVAGYVKRGPGARNIRLLKAPDLNEDTEVSTVMVPIVGRVPCGIPLLAEENIEDHVRVSTRLARPPHKYFILETEGTSMNRAGIPEGAFVLVRRQFTADNGDRVVALIDGEATIKVLRRTKNAIVLEPRSTNSKHKPIILTRDFQILGVVRSIIDL